MHYHYTLLCENRILLKKDTFTCFIDLKKAFDSVNRNLLWYKLQLYGLNGALLNNITALYKCVEYSLEINDHQTKCFEVKRGVKQGCILSPTLFNIFINDLIPFVQEFDKGIAIDNCKVSILLYADDIVLVAENEQDLQTLIDRVDFWCEKNEMNININKTKILHIRNKSTVRSNFSFNCNQSIIEYCNEYKYLGIYFNEFLNTTQIIDHAATSARKTLAGIIARSKMLGGLMYKSYTQLYNSLVVPIMDYGAVLWGHSEHPHLSMIQNNAMRFFMGCSKTMPIAALTGEMGWLSVQYRHMIIILKMYINLESDYECDDTLFLLYKWSKNIALLNKNNWVWKCMKLMSIIKGINNELAVSDVIPSYSQLRRAIHTLAFNEWQYQLHKCTDSNSEFGGKLVLYRQFQFEPVPSGYVTANISPGRRWVMANIRGGCLPLAIETGRYHAPKIPLSKRICIHCDSGEIEDIAHFILFCNKYENIRISLFKFLTSIFLDFITFPVDLKLYIILCNQCNCQTSLYLYKMFKTRIT